MKIKSILILLWFLVVLYMIVAWIVNVVKLIECDFASPWKDEIVHLLGLLPGISMITCWF